MNHTSWRYRRRRNAREQREFCEAQSRRVSVRWARAHATQAAEPVRQTRIVELPIRDTHRAGAPIRMEAEPTRHGFGRWLLTENGEQIGTKRLGRRQVEDMIASWLQ